MDGIGNIHVKKDYCGIEMPTNAIRKETLTAMNPVSFFLYNYLNIILKLKLFSANSQISEVTTTTTKKPVTTSRPTTVRPIPTWRPTTTTSRPVTTWRPTTTTAKPVTTWRPTTTVSHDISIGLL